MKCKVNLIDTPGIGDTRLFIQSKSNFKNDNCFKGLQTGQNQYERNSSRTQSNIYSMKF